MAEHVISDIQGTGFWPYKKPGQTLVTLWLCWSPELSLCSKTDFQTAPVVGVNPTRSLYFLPTMTSCLSALRYYHDPRFT